MKLLSLIQSLLFCFHVCFHCICFCGLSFGYLMGVGLVGLWISIISTNIFMLCCKPLFQFQVLCTSWVISSLRFDRFYVLLHLVLTFWDYWYLPIIAIDMRTCNIYTSNSVQTSWYVMGFGSDCGLVSSGIDVRLFLLITNLFDMLWVFALLLWGHAEL